MFKNGENLMECLINWWLSKRPLAWDFNKHLKNPSINAATEKERALAKAFSAFLLENSVLLKKYKKLLF